MTRIESRPSHRRKWDYVFFIDLEGHAQSVAAGTGARRAQAPRVAVPRARLLPAGGAVSADAPASAAARYRVLPGGTMSGTHTVPGDKSISHRALMLGAIADGRRPTSRASSPARIASRRSRALARARCAHRAAGRTPRSSCTASALRRLARRRRARSTWATPAPRCGCSWDCWRRRLRLDARRRRVADAPADGARGGAARADGRADRHPATGGRRCGSAARARLRGIHYEHAGRECAGEVRGAARRAVCRRRHARSPSPRPRAITPSACWRAFGVALERDGAATLALARRAARCAGTAVEVPGDFSSAAFFIVAGCLGGVASLTLAQRRASTRRAPACSTCCALMGADIRVHARTVSAAPGAEPVADIEIRPQPVCAASRVPERLVPLAIDEFPVFFVAAACAEGETRGARAPRNCASRRAIGSRSMADGLGDARREHELLLADWAARSEGGSIGRRPVDSHGDHRIAMAFAIAELCAPRRRSRSWTSPTSPPRFPGSPQLARAAGLRIEAR